MSSKTLAEARRRRTFAIISHPDAGKTTLTEKFLLYGGAIEAAGAVKARRGGRAVVSDWMELEQRRGISVSSTVLRFEHRDHVLNLLDTPGHRDFSEDTYRVLTAADAAVRVLDAAKGSGSWMRSRRSSPSEPHPSPGQWASGASSKGWSTVEPAAFIRFRRTAGGATTALEERFELSRLEHEGSDGIAALEEIALLDEVGAQVDPVSFLAGDATPVFFGSALWNFGVRLLLDAVVDLAPSPRPRPDVEGGRRPLDAPFAGQVFKVQANLDPRHRDRLAFVRVCSGRFERGMQVVVARTGRSLSTSYSHELFGRDRDTLEEAFPGDVVGLVNARDLRLGDTLYAGDRAEFPPIPSFAPEHFAAARPLDPSRHKQYRRGLATLEEEGVIQVLSDPVNGHPVPVLAVVGPMQCDVALHRMAQEFGAPVELSQLPYTVARLTDADGAAALRDVRGVEVLSRTDGTLLALFPNDFWLEQARKERPEARVGRVRSIRTERSSATRGDRRGDDRELLARSPRSRIRSGGATEPTDCASGERKPDRLAHQLENRASAFSRRDSWLGRRHVAAPARVARPRIDATGRRPLVAAAPLPQWLRRVAEVLGAAQPTPTPYIALPTGPARVAGDNQSLRLASAA